MLKFYILFFALAVYHRNKETYIYFKTLTSLTFWSLGIYQGIRSGEWMLVPVLTGFLIGDIMLATKLKRSFLYGMGGFFLADVWLISCLYQHKSVEIADIILSILVIIFVKKISKHPKMHLGHYKKPMYAYGFVISLAVSAAIGCMLQYETMRWTYLAAGMGLYFVSDFLLMFQYFYKTPYREVLKIAKMLTYFTGAYLIAASMGV